MPNRIKKNWLFNAFDALKKDKLLSSTNSSIISLYERSHIIGILKAAGWVKIIPNRRPQTVEICNTFPIKELNSQLWLRLRRQLPKDSKFTTLVQEKENIIVGWDAERVQYESTGNKIKSEIRDQLESELSKMSETDRTSEIKQRIGQNILKKLLLQEYDNQCAMCAVNSPEVLRASHIIPWSKEEKTRLDPSNAILLCGLHDASFDKNLIFIDKKYKILIPEDLPKGLFDTLKKSHLLN